MTFHQFMAEWSQWFWPVFAKHLFQATLFAFVIWIVVKFFNRAPSRYRYIFWIGALMKFLIPSALLVWLIGQTGHDLYLPFETVPSTVSEIATVYNDPQIIFQTAEPVLPFEQAALSNTAAGATTAHLHHLEIYCVLTTVWMLGAMAFFARWLSRRRHFARSMHSGQIISSGREFDAFNRARSCLVVNRDIGLVVSSQVREPDVFRSDGVVDSVKVVNGLTDGLTQMAIEAAKKILFEPAIKEGRPVNVRSIVEFHFSFDQRQTDQNQ